MLVTWKYKERDTIIQRLDPRARIIFMLCAMFSIIQFWDLRVEILFFCLSLAYYFLARLSWKETRRAWLAIGFMISTFTFLTFLTGRGGTGVYEEEHLIYRSPPLSLPIIKKQISLDITAERIVFSASQLFRMFAITGLAITIPYTINPALYGVTFHGLGLPDKFACAMDLAFRFVPTLGRDFSITLDAQRARGYEVEKLEGGVLAQIRKLAPLVVPVTINAIVGGEDVIDAMDLRCFGLRKRTWLYKLEYKRRDKILIAAGLAMFVLSTAASISGYGRFWVPRWLLDLSLD